MSDPGPTVGDPAPDFTLPATDRTPVTLSSFQGRHNVLLAFFPLAFTGTCTTEMCAFTEDFDQFESARTKVFGISCDAGPSLGEFKSKYGMTVELLSDFKKEVARQYGILNEEYGFSERAYFIVDREGVLRWKHVETGIGERRDNSELLTQLEMLT